jgi:hypothetical protein
MPVRFVPFRKLHRWQARARFVGSSEPPVLLGNDVLDVVRKRRVLLPEQAVFAPVPGSPSDQVPRFRVGHGRAFEVSLR